MRTRSGRLRKVAKWLLIANGVLWPVLILVLVLAPDDENTEMPAEPVASRWVLTEVDRGPKASEWAKPDDPGYRKAEPAPVRSPVPTPAATTSVVVPKPTASTTTDGYLDSPGGNCGRIMARDRDDLDAARGFCSFFDSGLMTGVTADGPALSLWVGEDLARALIADQLKGRQTVLDLMKMWKVLSGVTSLVVTVYWQDVDVVRGDTTVMRGDMVTYGRFYRKRD